jgi:hypothetical protein
MTGSAALDIAAVSVSLTTDAQPTATKKQRKREEKANIDFFILPPIFLLLFLNMELMISIV